jgi:hypothetical protein
MMLYCFALIRSNFKTVCAIVWYCNGTGDDRMSLVFRIVVMCLDDTEYVFSELRDRSAPKRSIDA